MTPEKRCCFGTLYTWYSEEQFWRCLLKSFWHVCSMPSILKTWEANIILTYGLLMSVWLVAMTFCLDYHIEKPTTQACGPWFRFVYSIGWNSRYSFAESEDEKFTILQPSYIHFDTLITASGKGRYILGRNVQRKVCLRVRKQEDGVLQAYISASCWWWKDDCTYALMWYASSTFEPWYLADRTGCGQNR